MRFACIAAALVLCACTSTKPTETAAPKKAEAPPKILVFYPSQNVVGRGEKVLICYGVENAASVAMDPPAEDLRPVFNRCFEHAPKASGKYTLRATGKDGTVVEQSFDLQVDAKVAGAASAAPKKAGALIHFFSGSKQQAHKGEAVMLCYEVGAESDISLTPSPGVPLARPKGCVQVTPQSDTTYQLTARGASGGTDTEQVRIRIVP